MFDLEDYKEKAKAAFKDLKAFVEKHGCIVAFTPDGTVVLSWLNNDNAFEGAIKCIDMRWTWGLMDSETGKLIHQEMSDTLKQEERDINRLQELSFRLDPIDQTNLMIRIAAGEDFKTVIAEFEEKARPLFSQSIPQQPLHNEINIPLAENFSEVVKPKKRSRTRKK